MSDTVPRYVGADGAVYYTTAAYEALEQELAEARQTIRVLHQFDTENAIALGKVKQELVWLRVVLGLWRTP